MALDNIVHQQIEFFVRSGYFQPMRIVQYLVEEVFEPGLDAGELADAVDAAVQACHAEAQAWTLPTDNDRLDRAFAQLGKSGFVALQNAGHSRSDGMEMVHAARDEQGGKAAAYCFWHWQCLQHAIRGQGLNLYFGSFDANAGAEDMLAVGRTVAAALQQAGLSVQWDGTAEKSIQVTPFKWRRPVVTEPDQASWHSADTTRFKLFYHDYRDADHGGYGSFENNPSLLLTRARIARLMAGVLRSTDNFIGLADEHGRILQFILNADGSVSADHPMPEKGGSLQKDMGLDEAIALMLAAQVPFSEAAVPGGEFMAF